jgi:hypothetical protein
MTKENLVESLLSQKAEQNNTIDLNTYAIGLGDMYDEIVKIQLNTAYPGLCDSFQVDNTTGTSSATQCSNCGREKFLHSIKTIR